MSLFGNCPNTEGGSDSGMASAAMAGLIVVKSVRARKSRRGFEPERVRIPVALIDVPFGKAGSSSPVGCLIVMASPFFRRAERLLEVLRSMAAASVTNFPISFLS